MELNDLWRFNVDNSDFELPESPSPACGAPVTALPGHPGVQITPDVVLGQRESAEKFWSTAAKALLGGGQAPGAEDSEELAKLMKQGKLPPIWAKLLENWAKLPEEERNRAFKQLSLEGMAQLLPLVLPSVEGVDPWSVFAGAFGAR